MCKKVKLGVVCCAYYRVLARNDRPRVTIARIKFQLFFISTNIAPIKAILDLLESLKPKESYNYTKNI